MYNEEQKRRYIKEKEENIILCPFFLDNMFKKSAVYENEIDKDIANFTVYEILDYFKTRNFICLESIKVEVSQLKLYTQWCLKEGLLQDGQNHFMEIDLPMMYGCINKLVASKRIIDRNTMLEWLQIMPNPRDQFVFLCLFEFGKSNGYQDIGLIKLSDFNGNNLTLHSGRTVKVSDKLISLAQEAVAENKYYPVNEESQRIYELSDNGYVVKYFHNVKSESSLELIGRRIASIVTRNLNLLEEKQWMNGKAFEESGKIHMLKTRAAELGLSNNEYLYSEHITEIDRQYDCKTIRKTFELKYGDFL